MAKPIRTIAVLRSAGLGDFIMSTPAFVALRRRFPEARIALITLHSQSSDQAAKVKAYAGGANVAPWVDLIRPHALDEVHVLPPIRSLATLRAARRQIAGVRPDLIVHLIERGTPYRRRVAKLAFMAALFGAVRQIGWRHLGQIHPQRPPRHDPHLGHHVQGLLDFVRELDQIPQDAEIVPEFDLRPDATANLWANAWITAHRRSGERLVAVAPGAIHDHKRWPIEQFAELLRRLDARHANLRFVIVGPAKDAPLAETLVAIDPARIHDLCGQSTIAQSAALFRDCALVVGNDGGAMHLADAMGARVVSIVPGLEFPDSIEPWNNRDRAIRHPVPCAPCYSFTFCPQGHRRCMLDLPLADVLAQCERAL